MRGTGWECEGRLARPTLLEPIVPSGQVQVKRVNVLGAGIPREHP